MHSSYPSDHLNKKKHRQICSDDALNLIFHVTIIAQLFVQFCPELSKTVQSCPNFLSGLRLKYALQLWQCYFMPTIDTGSTQMKLLCNGWHPLVLYIPQLQNIGVYGIINPLKKRTNLTAQGTVNRIIVLYIVLLISHNTRKLNTRNTHINIEASTQSKTKFSVSR